MVVTVTLLTSLSKLQLMLDVYCTVGIKYDLSFNPSKSLCSVFGICETNSLACLAVANTVIKRCNKVTYLGITFVFGYDLTVDITSRLHKFHATVSAVLKDTLPGREHAVCKLPGKNTSVLF